MIGYKYSAAWWRDLEAFARLNATTRPADGDAIAQREFAKSLTDSVTDDEADEGYFSQADEPAK